MIHEEEEALRGGMATPMGIAGKRRTGISLVLACCLGVAAGGCNKPEPLQADGVQAQGIMKTVATDKAAYLPGEKVALTLELAPSEEPITGLIVQYRHLGEIVDRQNVKPEGSKAAWSWTPPKDDFKGYLVEIYAAREKEIVDHMNIAVDVSSDWSKFPRYGYLADFPKMSEEQMQRVMDRLTRYRINGLQFYDWQYKHHDPLKLVAGEPAEEWPDIANRPVAFDTVKGYIELAHERNIKAMNYNLIFGAYQDAAADGVDPSWRLFKDPEGKEQDKHPLPGWASDIMLYDPSNSDWQNYLIAKESEVFKHLPFDGWHVDQLGDRGKLWNAKGQLVKLPQGYVSFLKAAKEKLNVYYVMNAVGQFGQGLLAALAPVDFLYTEVWGDHPEYKDLKAVLDQNEGYSRSTKNTVLAAYMNYDYSKSPGMFNTSGVLLTDAVIFASGGAHLELGENMLSSEYFPYKNLQIPPELEQQLIRYYDFLTAYQNVLRDGLSEASVDVASAGGPEISNTPKQGAIWSLAYEQASRQIVHLINFTDAVTMQWNDNEGTQREPEARQDLSISFPANKRVKSVTFASPDYWNGSPVSLALEEWDGQVHVTLPHLKYWDMLVVDYK